VLLESIVRRGSVAEVNLIPPGVSKSRSPATLVFCAVVRTVVIGAAIACEDNRAVAAAESMRVRLFKSNLL
jgi:hypothetical protein